MNKHITKSYLLMGLLFTICLPAMAQPPAPPATPIDGGLGILLAAGAAYSYRTVRKKKQ